MKSLYSNGPLYEAFQEGAGGGGSSAAPGFDQAAFQTAILAEVSKLTAAANAGLLKSVRADFAKFTAAAKPAEVTDASLDTDAAAAAAAAAAGKPPADPALAAQLRLLERRNKELADQFTAMKTESDTTKANADKKELDATVRTKLNKFKFADETAAEDAFEIFGSKVKRNEDGAFTGPDGTPIDQFLEEGMRLKPYLLAPKDIGGAGARGGKAPGAGKAVDFESIRPGMSEADMAAAAAQISAVLTGAR